MTTRKLPEEYWPTLKAQLKPQLKELEKILGPEEAEKQLRIELAKVDKEFFGRYYFPEYFTDKTPEWHYELDDIIENAKNNKSKKGAVIIAPRGHAKSTRASFLDTMHDILFDDFIDFVLIISDTGQQTEHMIASIKIAFETNERLREDFGDLVGSNYYPEQRWNNSNLTLCWPNGDKITKTGRPYIKKTKLIAGRSAGTSIRGLKHGASRPKKIILDDIENRDDVQSPLLREKLRNWFWADVMPMIDPKGTIIVIGTILHYDCILENLAKSDMFTSVRFRAIKEDGTPLWPERFPLAELEQLRKSMSALIFNQEYMNIPISPDVQVFPPKMFCWYNKNEIGYDEANTCWTFRGEPLTIFIGVDPAISEKEQNDETAITVIGVTKKLDIIVLECQSGHWTLPQQINKIINIYDDYIPFMMGIETNAYQKALKQAIQEKAILPIKQLTHKGDKFTRLVRMSTILDNGKFYMREALPGEPWQPDPTSTTPQRVHPSCYGLFEQMVEYPKSAHDDRVDSLEDAVSISDARKFFEINEKQ